MKATASIFGMRGIDYASDEGSPSRTKKGPGLLSGPPLNTTMSTQRLESFLADFCRLIGYGVGNKH